MMKCTWFATLACILGAFPAHAQSQDCSRALVTATVQSSNSELTNLAIAHSLSEAAWKESKQKAGANAIIYGVPVGGSWEDWKKNVRTKATQSNYHRFEQRASAYATSGIDPGSLTAYRDCLLFNSGLALVAGEIGANSYVLWVVYNPGVGVAPRFGKVVQTRNLDKASERSFTKEIAEIEFGRTDRQFSIMPANPKQEVVVNIKIGNTFSRSIILPPLEIASIPRVTTDPRQKDAHALIINYATNIERGVQRGERTSASLDRDHWQPFLVYVRNQMEITRLTYHKP